jgi:hypothetical protein
MRGELTRDPDLLRNDCLTDDRHPMRQRSSPFSLNQEWGLCNNVIQPIKAAENRSGCAPPSRLNESTLSRPPRRRLPNQVRCDLEQAKRMQRVDH